MWRREPFIKEGRSETICTDPDEGHIRAVFLFKILFSKIDSFPYSVVEYTAFVGFISIFYSFGISSSYRLEVAVATFLYYTNRVIYGVLNYLSTRQYTQIRILKCIKFRLKLSHFYFNIDEGK